MNKKTPKKSSTNSNSGYSPITLHTSPAAQSPQRNLTGTPRIIRDLVADLYNNIQKWNSLHIKGCAVVKRIASLKADEPRDYSSQLEEYANELAIVVAGLKANSDLFGVLVKQVEAFSRLPNVAEPVFFSLVAEDILRLFKAICMAYEKEFKIKQFILQNIAHSKSKHDAMFLATRWTHQLDIGDDIIFNLESLLLEVGHRPIQ